MEEQRRGDPGYAASRLGLGMAGVGRPAYHTIDHGLDFPEGRSHEQMRLRSCQMLDAAFEAGIRYVDVARSYGAAETFVRDWANMRHLTNRDLTIGSKWGYRYVGDWRIEADHHEIKDHSLGMLVEQRDQSLTILGSLLSLYQVHSVTDDDPLFDDPAVLDELARLKERGVRVGLTVTGPHQADAVSRAMEVDRDGVPLFDSIQATWNLLERTCEGQLREAHDAGRWVIVKEPLANGRLTSRGEAGAAGVLSNLARDCGVGPDAVAVAAALAQKWADVVLLGANTVPQLKSNLSGLRLSLSPEAHERLSVLREEPRSYWRRRSTLSWT